jgi:probable HAF family extracellular repeat protein
MSRAISGRIASALILLLQGFWGGPIAHAGYYSVTDLAPPSGNFLDWTLASAINNHGVVVGQTYWPSHYSQGVIWDGANTQLLPSSASHYGYPVSSAQAINAAGQVVGVAYGEPSSRNGNPTAFLWSGGSSTNLGMLPGGTISYARGINDAGRVVGSSNSGQSGSVPVTWTSGVIAELPLIAGGVTGEAWSINGAEQIVGYLSAQPNVNQPVTWLNGMASLLPVPQGWTGGYAWQVNGMGRIAGAISTPADVVIHAAVWDQGAVIDLGTLPGFVLSNALDVNERGVVVGVASNPSQPYQTYHGFVWDTAHGLRDLNDLIDPASGWLLGHAFGINDRGQIVGLGISPSGAEHGFLLTPIAAPGVLGLLLVGSILMFIGRTVEADARLAGGADGRHAGSPSRRRRTMHKKRGFTYWIGASVVDARRLLGRPCALVAGRRANACSMSVSV